MNELDRLLADPRAHRAVADREMSERVAARALARFQREQRAQSQRRTATRPELDAAVRRWLPTPRRPVLLAAVCVLSAASLILARAAMQAGLLRRFDILLGYWLEDVGDRLALTGASSPLLLATFLASFSCWLGLALSPRARLMVRTAFTR